MKQSPKPGLEEVIAKAEAETPRVVFNHRSIPELWNSRIDRIVVMIYVFSFFTHSMNDNYHQYYLLICQMSWGLQTRCLHQLQRELLDFQDFLHYRVSFHSSSRYDLPYCGGGTLE